MKYLIKGNDIPHADWKRVLLDENNKIYFLLKYSINAFAGKFNDNSTESDWWWKPNNIKTSIADKVDSATKEFNFEHQLDTAHHLFSSNNKIEKIYHFPDTSKVTDMGYMFSVCSSLTSLDFSNFNTSNVTSMEYMFAGCTSLTSLDLSNFNTSNVTNMDDMFSECSSLTALDLSNFNTSNVTSMVDMIESCTGLTSLDVGNFDTSNVMSMDYMFYSCSGLTTVTGVFEGTKVDLDISDSPLTNTSAMVFINGLANVTETKTIKFKATTYNTLTPEQIAVATSKGWTVVSA